MRSMRIGSTNDEVEQTLNQVPSAPAHPPAAEGAAACADPLPAVGCASRALCALPASCGARLHIRTRNTGTRALTACRAARRCSHAWTGSTRATTA
eukprot:7381979-Prymnesium_polylepis.1